MIKLNKNPKRWLWWILLTVLLGVIFMFTAFQTFTGEHTQIITRHITGLNEYHAYLMNALVRKLAHVIIFGFIGILFYRVIRKRSLWYAWFSATLVAMLDEWHQSFVPGRSPLIQDVVLDSLAAFSFLAILLYLKRR
jgi:VanZ family protein